MTEKYVPDTSNIYSSVSHLDYGSIEFDSMSDYDLHRIADALVHFDIFEVATIGRQVLSVLH